MVQTTTDTGDAVVFATAFLCQGWILRSPSLSRRGENPSIFSQKREEKSNFEALEISFTNFGRSKKKKDSSRVFYFVSKFPLHHMDRKPDGQDARMGLIERLQRRHRVLNPMLQAARRPGFRNTALPIQHCALPHKQRPCRHGQAALESHDRKDQR